MTDETPSLNAARIELLEKFHSAILQWFNAEYTSEKKKTQLRSFINQNTLAARTAVSDAGCLQLINMAPPPAIGGPLIQNADPFSMIFESLWGQSMIPNLADMIDQAIGVYQHLDSSTGLVHIRKREVIDIENALERALRPTFRTVPPGYESEVQDAVENILNAVGVEFTREKDRAPVGPRGFVPDFVVANLDLAIEVKLANVKHGASAIQEELAADISAYRTKWRHLLAVIYDVGVIHDPYQFRIDNMRHFGVTIVIVKH